MKILLISIGALFLAVSERILPSNKNVYYEGRYVLAQQYNQEVIQFDNPGFSISVAVRGTSYLYIILSAIIDVDVEPNRLWLYLNDTKMDTVIDTSLYTNNSLNKLLIASNLDKSYVNIIKVTKITEADFNKIEPKLNYLTFHGFEFENGEIFPVKNQQIQSNRRIEFLGDSITAGYCNMCDVDSSLTKGYQKQSFALSWASLVCKNFQASCNNIAWSGFGLVRNCCGGETHMTDVYQRSLSSDSSSIWNFSAWTPQVMVINLGTNDFYQTPNKTKTKLDYIATYVQLVKKMSTMYDNCTFFLGCGSIITDYCPYVKAVIGILTRENEGISVYFLNQTKVPNSCCGHPGSKDDVIIADRTTKIISTVMGW